ncbi:MAG TPA: hypothetical protein VFI31_27445 [Pirellulales bacterium]|nr:hypothetical protein [Pirellulales bacterium]
MPIGTRRAAQRKAVKARRWRKPPLYITQILAWADAHHEETGHWPRKDSGRVRGTLEENWFGIDTALRIGLRGLPRGDSLARLLARFRGVRNRKALPPYTVDQILGWADAFFKRHGRWPARQDGPIGDAPGETWMAVDMALGKGLRGLRGGSSLAKLLAAQRGRRNKGSLRPLELHRILAWADAHYKRTGMWPTHESGPVQNARGETWRAVDKALRNGRRGLKGGSSLPRLLYRCRGVPLKERRQPPLAIKQILGWADAYHERTGKWPKVTSGPIPEVPGETWNTVQIALHDGKRGLNRGTSLAKLFAEHRGVRNIQELPDLTVKQILVWADAHFERHGVWPTRNSGQVEDALGENWSAVNVALSQGHRGLPRGSSLPRLLAERRGVRNRLDRPKFSRTLILDWADAYHRRTGMWPNDHSGPIAEMPDETWAVVCKSLRKGSRGLRGGLSLARLLKRERGVLPKVRRRPPLTIENILAWADAHHARTGHWPKQTSGKVPEAPRESWCTIDVALRKGARGLPKGLALGKLWAKYRGVRNVHSIAKFSTEQILRWADAHYRRTGAWPQVRSGAIEESPTDNWLSVDNALRLGLRGMPGRSSLKQLLDEHRRNGQAAALSRSQDGAKRRAMKPR